MHPARPGKRLNAEQFGRLALALTEDPELFHSWRLLQEIYGVYDAGDEGEARERIESFVHHWHETAIPEFRSVLKALAQWMPEILAFHRFSCNERAGSHRAW